MKKQAIECYVCSSCGKPYLNDWEHNEERCAQFLREQDQRKRDYDTKVEFARSESLKLAQHSRPMSTLVEHKHWEAARKYAITIYDEAGLPDLGCSSLMESIYDTMVKSVMEATGFAQGGNE